MRFSSIRIDEIRLRLDDLAEGLNVVYLASPDKRRLIAAAARGVFPLGGEEPCQATISLQTSWGNYRLEVDTSRGERVFREVPHGCSAAEAVRRLEAICTAESFARVCSPRLGEVLALQETAYHVCGSAVAAELRSAWEKFIHELEWTRTTEAHHIEIQRLREEQADLRAQLGLESPNPSENLTAEMRRRWIERWYVCRYAVRRLKARAARCQEEDRREQLAHRIGRWQRSLLRCCEKLGIGTAIVFDGEQAPPETRALYARLREVESRLRHLEKLSRQQAHWWLSRVQQLLEQPVRSPVLQRASDLLGELSGGQLIALHTVQMGKELLVEQPNKKRLSCDVLSKAERVVVHLALCLSAIEAAFQVGCLLPLLINDSLRYLPTGQLRTVIEALRRHARQYGQVLLLTGQPHLAALCRSLGIAVHTHGPIDQPAAASPMAAQAAQAEKAWQKISSDPVAPDPNSTFSTSTAEQPLGAADLPGPPQPAGSINDQLAGGQQPGSAQCTSNMSVGETSLSSTATIDRMEWLPMPVREFLRTCGIRTVGALLRSEPSSLVARCPSAITADQLERHQAEARLLCRVPGLKPYDARVLVACGITTAEQLAQLQPAELFRLVESLLATPEGSELIRGGNSDDIQRLTRWLRRMRASRHQPRSRSEGRPLAPVHGADTLEQLESNSGKDVPGHRLSPASPLSDHRADLSGPAAEKSRCVMPYPSHTATDGHLQAQPEDASRWSLARLPGMSRPIVKKLAELGVCNLEQLLEQNAGQLAAAINRKTVRAHTVQQWQQLARLLGALPELEPVDAQLLLLAGIESVEHLRSCEPHALYLQLQRAARTAKGRKLLKDRQLPSLQQVTTWVVSCRDKGHSKAA